MNKSLIIASLAVVTVNAFGVPCGYAENRCREINSETVFLHMRMENRPEQGKFVAIGNVFIPEKEKERKNTRSKCSQRLKNENKFLKAALQEKCEEVAKLKQKNRHLNRDLKLIKKRQIPNFIENGSTNKLDL